MADNGLNESQKKLIDELAKSMGNLNDETEDSSESFKRHNDIVSDFEQRTRKAKNTVSSLTAAVEVYGEGIEKSTHSIHENKKQLGKLQDALLSNSITLEEYRKNKDELDKSTTAHNENIKRQKTLQESANSAIERANKNVEKYRGVLSNFADTSKQANKLAKEFWSGKRDPGIKSTEAYAKLIDKVTKLRIKDIEQQRKSGAMTDETAKKSTEEATSYAQNLIDPSGKVTKNRNMFLAMDGKSPTGEDISPERAAKAKDKFRSSVVSEAGALKSNIGGFFKGDQSSAKALSDQFSSFHTASKGMVAAGKAATTLGGAMKLLGLAFSALSKLTIVTAIIGVVAALVSLVGRLDEFIKAANKSYFSLAGPITGLDGITENMREFQDTVYGVDLKVKYGLDTEEVTEVFKSMQGEGMDLNGVKKRIGSYDKALESSAILSRTFGVSIEDMGGMVADQMMNLQSSLDGVSESFRKMSFDASQAGVSSKQFYQQIQNATAGLSFYGNYLSSTSSLLANFMDEGIIGFQNASKHLTNLMQGLGNMSADGLRKIHAIIGPDAARAIAEENAKSVSDMYDESVKKLASAKAYVELTVKGSKEREAAEAEVAIQEQNVSKLRGDKDYAEYQSKSGDILDVMAAYKQNRLTDPYKAVFDLTTALRTGLTDMSETATTRLNALMETTGEASYEDFQVMRERAVKAALALRGSDAGQSLYDASKLNDGGGAASLDELTRLFKRGSLSKDQVSKQTDVILNTLGGKSGQESLSKTLKDLKGQNINYLKAFIKAKEKGDFSSAAEMIEKVFQESVSLSGESGTVAEAEAAKIAGKVSDLQTPISKYLGIGKDAIEYAAASSDIQTTIAAGVTQTAKYTLGILQYTKDKFMKDNSWETHRLSQATAKAPEDLVTRGASDKERLIDIGYDLESLAKEKQRIETLPEEEKKVGDYRFLKHYDQMVKNLEGARDTILKDPKNETVQGLLQDYLEEGRGIAVAQTPEQSSRVSAQRLGKLLGNKQREFNPTPQISKEDAANGSARLETKLEALLNPSQATLEARRGILSSLDKGLKGPDQDYLLNSPDRMGEYLDVYFKSSNGKPLVEALKEKESVEIHITTDQGASAEFVKGVAKGVVNKNNTNSEKK